MSVDLAPLGGDTFRGLKTHWTPFGWQTGLAAVVALIRSDSGRADRLRFDPEGLVLHGTTVPWADIAGFAVVIRLYAMRAAEVTPLPEDASRLLTLRSDQSTATI